MAVTLLTQVVIRRRPLFYTVNLLLPSIFLMVMDIVGFYLPPDSGERVSFKITLLLGYSVFLIIVSDTLPATAIGTPLIGKHYLLLRERVETRERLLQHCVSWLRSAAK